MKSEKFVGSQGARSGRNAEKQTLSIVDPQNVDRIHLVIVDYVHPVVRDAEDDKRHQRHHQAACGGTHQKKRRDKKGQPKVFGSETDT